MAVGLHLGTWTICCGPSNQALHVLGAYAEYIAVSVSMLVHKPAELSWEETAGIPEAITPSSGCIHHN